MKAARHNLSISQYPDLNKGDVSYIFLLNAAKVYNVRLGEKSSEYSISFYMYGSRLPVYNNEKLFFIHEAS